MLSPLSPPSSAVPLSVLGGFFQTLLVSTGCLGWHELSFFQDGSLHQVFDVNTFSTFGALDHTERDAHKHRMQALLKAGGTPFASELASDLHQHLVPHGTRLSTLLVCPNGYVALAPLHLAPWVLDAYAPSALPGPEFSLSLIKPLTDAVVSLAQSLPVGTFLPLAGPGMSMHEQMRVVQKAPDFGPLWNGLCRSHPRARRDTLLLTSLEQAYTLCLHGIHSVQLVAVCPKNGSALPQPFVPS